MNPTELDAIRNNPSPATWRKVVEVASSLAPRDVDKGLASLESAIRAWSPDPARQFWSSMTAWRAKDAGSWVAGELRRAPLSWMSEILSGAHAPRHGLVRAVCLDGTKATAATAARIFESPYLDSLRVLDAGRDVKLAPAFFKKLVKAKNLGAVETLTYYPLKLGGGRELAGATNLGALRRLNLRAIVYSASNSESAADVDELFRAPWLGQIETLESSMGISTGWSRSASIFKPLRAHSARLTSLRRLILHDACDLDDLTAAPVLDQIEELIVQVENAKALRIVLTKLDERGLPRLRRLDLSQHRYQSAQKRDGFTPLSDAELRSIVAPTKLAKKVEDLVLAPA